MRHLLFLVLVPCLLGNPHASGQKPSYPVSAIDPVLLENASMVVRKSEWVININSLNSETITVHQVLTILKGSADQEANFVINYNNWSDVDHIEGTVYNANGMLVKKFGKKDIMDQSAIGDGTLYSDERIKFIRPMIAEYPFTVEYFVKLSFRHMLAYPTWSPQHSYNTAVESATLEIHADEGFFPRFKAIRMPDSVIIMGDGKQSKSWEIRNLPAIVEEQLSPSLTDLVPVIYLEAKTFSVKGYTGDFSSWKSFGEWITSLQESRDSLDSEMHTKVSNLIKGIDNKKEKINQIYRFMQSTCRYVDVHVGIGGIQSEKADKVARLGYGDCKGLVNYTAALLKVAGIPSHYTLVRAGKNAEAIQYDFPGNQFNHIILCVPVDNDTIWLECTAMKMPFGYLGNFTDDRDVLVVTPQGGQLKHTPVYSREQNTSSRKTLIIVDSTGNASAQIRSIYRGLQFDPVMELPYISADKQKESLRKRYDIPGVTFSSATFKPNFDSVPVMEETAEAMIPKFSSITGNRMFIFLNRFLNNPGTFLKDDQRKYDVVIPYPFIDYDTVVIEFPRGYKIEGTPSSVEMKSPFGILKSEVKTDGKTITLYRRFEMEKGRYPATQYNAFVEFLRQVSKQDRSSVVAVK